MKILITEQQNKMLKKNREVFLGGTCNNSTWRDDLIPMLEIGYFNPVVKNWTESDAAKEIEKRKSSDYVLYVITPKMEGVLSIAEVADDSNKKPKQTIFCVLEKDDKEFSKSQIKSLEAVKAMVKDNGATVCTTLKEVAEFLNK